MPQVSSIKVRAQWGYTGDWATEFATCTFRLAPQPGPDLPPVGVQVWRELSTTASATGEGGDDATWSWMSNWAADFPADGVDQVYGQELQLVTANRILAWWNSFKNLYAPDIYLKEVKIVGMDNSGDSPFPASTFALKTPSAGTANMSPLANLTPQVSMVVSFGAPVAGRMGRGRVYLPAPALGPVSGASRFMPSAYRTAITDATKTLIQDFPNLDVARPGDCYFMPAVGSDKTGFDVYPTRIGVGRKFDVQRRRANQVTENTAYTSVTY